MQIISNLLIPIITIIVIIYGLYKKIDIFSSFIKGLEEGLHMSITLFPTIMAMVIAINLLINSNIIVD